jgi:hypothetical protein
MSLTGILGKLLEIEDLESIEAVAPSFAAPWAHDGPAWLLFGCLGLGALALVFYSRYQPRARAPLRIVLAVSRALLLGLLLLFLAEPVLSVKVVSSPRPLLWILFDGTDSMNIEDDLSESEEARLRAAVGLEARDTETAAGGSGARGRSRADHVRALLRKRGENPVARLAERFRLRAFLLERADGVRLLDASPEGGGEEVDLDRLADALSAEGEVTALGDALGDLARRHTSSALAGLLVVSDFNQNSGPSPLAAARRLGVPVHTLGVGPASAVDLGVDLQAPLLLKKAERSSLNVTLRQTGLEGRTVSLRLTAEPRPAEGDASVREPLVIAERSVELREPSTAVAVPYVPAETGRYVLLAEVAPIEGEIVGENNRAEREISVRDDFLRLMFVEYEPTWEWRFIKEVFHRDQLVGTRGFRTFLRSADPKVRQTNDLFLATMTPKRSDFFASDVIFLGDMPAATVSTRFSEMVREFVSQFGGGLVVIAGPRFGPGHLAGTPLADMLPVVVDPDARRRDTQDFRPRLTPAAAHVDFMRLGEEEDEHLRGWENLGWLPWYQPVARLHPLATALLEHPLETCADGTTRQPLIAIRRYGRGEVVYLGFNETWRLRRKYGELFYRRFWGEMIYRLGLSHAVGSQKRFVVRTDRQEYQADDRAVVTVEAYDADFEPLGEEDLPGRKLAAELILPEDAGGDAAGGGGRAEALAIPEARRGVFEVEVPLLLAGEHRVQVRDPVTGEDVAASFQVASLSVERREAARNVALEREVAAATGGRNYDLETIARLPDEIDMPRERETTVRIFPLWNTWLAFGVIIFLMLGEWLLRKLVHLS